MVKNHIKTLASPKTWPVQRKSKRYILRPAPGAHSLKLGVSLNFALVDMLKAAGTKREATYLLHDKNVLVDGKRRRAKDFIVGLFDILSLADLKKHYRMLMTKKGKLILTSVEEKEAHLKPCKVIGKKLVKGKAQVNLSDGRNFLAKEAYKVGDTVLFDLKTQQPAKHLKLEKGSTILLTGGKHLGSLGTVEDVLGQKLIYRMGKDVQETRKAFAFVVDDSLTITP